MTMMTNETINEIDLSNYDLLTSMRLKERIGNYVLYSYGCNTGKVIFYQDRKISSKRYWTYFLNEAMFYTSITQASIRKNSLSKNKKPNILKVMYDSNRGIYLYDELTKRIFEREYLI